MWNFPNVCKKSSIYVSKLIWNVKLLMQTILGTFEVDNRKTFKKKQKLIV